MRKLIVSNIVSLDGYVAGAGGNVMVLPMDDAFNAYNAERLRAASTLLLGRNSYEGFQSYWPSVQADPSQSADNREISRLNDAIEKVVVSDSLALDGTGPWAGTTQVVGRHDAAGQLSSMKTAGGGDILVFGSRTMWNGLLEAGVIDELHLMVAPLFLGSGVPAFSGAPAATIMPAHGQAPLMELRDVRRFEGSDNVVLQYAVR